MPLHKIIPSLFPPLSNNFLIDGKSNERVFRAMEKVIRLCQHEKLQLKNSPPYILEILPELYPLLQTAIKHVLYEISSFSALNDKQFLVGTTSGASDIPIFQVEYIRELWERQKIPENLANAAIYLKVFLTNVFLKCRDVIHLFKEDVGLVQLSDPRSSSRERLSHISLILSNMWKEFESMFSVSVAEDKSKFVGLSFRITKQEGAAFWEEVFPKQCIVHWSQFVQVFTSWKESFRIVTSDEHTRLKSTFDITENDYVSIFEFDIFVRLFHPFRNLIHNWHQITSHPGYMGFKTYDEVCAILAHHTARRGSYVFRVSCTKLGQWSIGYVDSQSKILQTIPSTSTLIEALNRGVDDHYYLYPNGQDFNPHLKAEVDDVEKVVVTEEEQEIYHMMDSTYEECKLCYERPKDSRIEPCGHLICRQCLEQIRKLAKPECPWCRREIRGNANVTVIQATPSEKEDLIAARKDSASPGFSSSTSKPELSTDRPEREATNSRSINPGSNFVSGTFSSTNPFCDSSTGDAEPVSNSSDMANGCSEGDIQIEPSSSVLPPLRNRGTASNLPLPQRPRSLYDTDYQSSASGNYRSGGARRTNHRLSRTGVPEPPLPSRHLSPLGGSNIHSRYEPVASATLAMPLAETRTTATLYQQPRNYLNAVRIDTNAATSEGLSLSNSSASRSNIMSVSAFCTNIDRHPEYVNAEVTSETEEALPSVRVSSQISPTSHSADVHQSSGAVGEVGNGDIFEGTNGGTSRTVIPNMSVLNPTYSALY